MLISLMRRHMLLRVEPAAWKGMLASKRPIAAIPLLQSWAQQGWPVIVRRALATDTAGLIPVGVPLPPTAANIRVALQFEPKSILSEVRPVSISDAMNFAPASWFPTLCAIAEACDRLGVASYVFGSLLWQTLTGLNYLRTNSDVDIFWPITDADQASGVTRLVNALQLNAPMRIDGELVFPDGAAIHWREFAADAQEVIVKTMRGVECRSRIALFATSIDVVR